MTSISIDYTKRVEDSYVRHFVGRLNFYSRGIIIYRKQGGPIEITLRGSSIQAVLLPNENPGDITVEVVGT